MSLWKAFLAAMVIFCAGAISGSLATKLYFSTHEPSLKNPPATPDFGFNQRLEYIRRLERQLSLTPEQHRQVEWIMRESQDRMKKLWQPIAPQAQAEFQQTRERIQEILTPEQRVKFATMSKYRPHRNKTQDESLVKEPPRERRRTPPSDRTYPANLTPEK